jgi:hypothetical protein
LLRYKEADTTDNIGIQGNNIFKGSIDDFYYEGVKYSGGVRHALRLKL